MKRNKLKVLSIFLSVILALSFEVPAFADNVKTNALSREDIRILESIFNPEYYAENNPDVVKQLGSDKAVLFEHFCTYGLYELRQPSTDFNVTAYAAAYNDLSNAFGTDVLSYYKHYYDYGKKECRHFTTPETLSALGINAATLIGSQKTVVDSNGRPQFNVFYEEDEKDFVVPSMDSDSDDSDNLEPEPEPAPEPAPAPDPAPVKHTVSFDVSDNNCQAPANQLIEDGGKVTKPDNPALDGYDFDGWYKNDLSTEWNFDTDTVTQDTVLYAKWTAKQCLAAGTLITMANGERMPVEKLKVGDEIRIFNHETGKISTAPIYDCMLFSENDPNGFTLHFSNNVDVTVVGGHCFFDKTANKYVAITHYTAPDFIGHMFYDADANRWETLESVEYVNEPIDSYFIATEKHFNCIANGMLSAEDGIYEIFLNTFDYGKDLMLDKAKKEADIKKYGLWDFDNLHYFSRHVYDALTLKYLSVSFGKGLISLETFEKVEEYYAALYPDLME